MKLFNLSSVVALSLLGLSACVETTPRNGSTPATAVMPATAAAADVRLLHRYSFSGDLRDSAGKVNGVAKGAVKFAGGKLVLDNGTKGSPDDTLAYVEFPAPLVPASGSTSVVFWFSATETQAFARVIDIGDRDGTEGHAFIYYTPKNAEDTARAAISAAAPGSKTYIDSAKLDDGKPHMVAIVIDGKTKKLLEYVDGKAVGEAQDLGDNTLDKVGHSHAWIGPRALTTTAACRRPSTSCASTTSR